MALGGCGKRGTNCFSIVAVFVFVGVIYASTLVKEANGSEEVSSNVEEIREGQLTHSKTNKNYINPNYSPGDENVCRVKFVVDGSFLEKISKHSISRTHVLINKMLSKINAIYIAASVHITFAKGDVDIKPSLNRNLPKGNTDILSHFARTEEYNRLVGETPSHLEFCIVHLLTAGGWRYTVNGEHIVDSACQGHHFGYTDFANTARMEDSVMTFVHEVSHALGARHDNSEACWSHNGVGGGNYSSGYLMDEWSMDAPTKTQMSPCTLALIIDYVTLNHVNCFQGNTFSRTAKATAPICGDYVIDVGERCDCGPNEEDCDDPCCDYSTCQLKSFARCSSTDGPCCSSTYQVEPSGVICDSWDDCKRPNRCNGQTASCSASFSNEYDRQLCDQGTGQCISGVCEKTVCDLYPGLSTCTCSQQSGFECALCCLNTTSNECLPTSKLSFGPLGVNHLTGKSCGLAGTDICNGEGLCITYTEELSNSGGEGLPIWTIVLIVLASVITTCLIGIVVWYLVLKMHRKDKGTAWPPWETHHQTSIPPSVKSEDPGEESHDEIINYNPFATSSNTSTKDEGGVSQNHSTLVIRTKESEQYLQDEAQLQTANECPDGENTIQEEQDYLPPAFVHPETQSNSTSPPQGDISANVATFPSGDNQSTAHVEFILQGAPSASVTNKKKPPPVPPRPPKRPKPRIPPKKPMVLRQKSSGIGENGERT
eukprot:Nk52_evm2s283 gene=Nk52_evmTU2s283